MVSAHFEDFRRGRTPPSLQLPRSQVRREGGTGLPDADIARIGSFQPLSLS